MTLTDVFISYAREDKPFVVRLHGALAALGRDVWVDWQDIPATSEWLGDVYNGITSASTFVFVVSPESIASEVCRAEIEHAASLNKRLVPVLRRPVEDRLVPPAIAKRNYIFIREEDDFDAAFRLLIQALDTDLGWVRAHTRLLVRAQEWDREGRNDSFLLRGIDLQNALQWRAEAAIGKQPQPAPLQIDYVEASKTWEAHEIERLHQLYRRALARQLGAQAEIVRLHRERLLMRSTLLALEAMRRFPSVEADQPLRRGLALLARQVADFPHSQSVWRVAFSPTGRYLATTAWDNSARIFDLYERVLVGYVAHPDRVDTVAFSPCGRYFSTTSVRAPACVWDLSSGQMVGVCTHPGGATAVAFSHDSRILATARTTAVRDNDTEVLLWTLPDSGTRLARRLAQLHHDAPVTRLHFSPDNETIATASGDGAVRLWTLRNGSEIMRWSLSGTIADLAFSADGCLLAVAAESLRVLDVRTGADIDIDGQFRGAAQVLFFCSDGTLLATSHHYPNERVWDVFRGRELYQIPVTAGFSRIFFVDDGTALVTASSDGTARVWSGGRELARLCHESGVYDITLSPDGQHIATASHDGHARIFERTAGDIMPMQHAGAAVSIAFSPDGTRFVTTSAHATSDRTARVWETATGRELLRLVHPAEQVPAAQFSPCGRFIATASSTYPKQKDRLDADNAVRIWSADSGEEIARFAHEGEVQAVAFSRDGHMLASASFDFTGRVWSLTERREIARVTHRNCVYNIAFSPDGRLVATASSAGACVWSALDGTVLLELDPDSLMNDVAFSPGSDLIATAGRAAKVWRVSTGELVTTIGDVGAHVVRFNASGEYVAGGSFDDAARVVRLADGEIVFACRHEDNVSDVAFTADGRFLATASADRTARVWDVAARREIARITHRSHVERLAFSPDERFLGTVSQSGRVLLNLWRPQDLIAEACRRLPRNLTEEEWREYLGDEPYSPTCSAPGGEGTFQVSADASSASLRICNILSMGR